MCAHRDDCPMRTEECVMTMYCPHIPDVEYSYTGPMKGLSFLEEDNDAGSAFGPESGNEA